MLSVTPVRGGIVNGMLILRTASLRLRRNR